MADWLDVANVLAGLLTPTEGVGRVWIGEEDLFTLAEVMELGLEPATEEEFDNEQMKVNCWMILRNSTTTEKGNLPPQQRMRRHNLVIRGYMGQGERSWMYFQAVVDNVMDALEKIDGANVTRNRDPDIDFMNISAPNASMTRGTFGPYACHVVEITLSISQRRKVNLVNAV